MAYKTKTKKRTYRVGVYLAKASYPTNVENFNIKAKSEKEAERIGKKRAIRENPDKPKNYWFTAVTGYGREK